jgi:hypothetical protein
MALFRRRNVLLRALALSVLLAANFAIPTGAAALRCELCAYCPQWPDLVPCCAPPPGGLGGVDDCHLDGGDCHEAGQYCDVAP